MTQKSEVKFSILTNYTIYAVDSFQPEGGESVQYIVSYLISVAAGVACYYIGKWLDRK